MELKIFENYSQLEEFITQLSEAELSRFIDELINNQLSDFYFTSSQLFESEDVIFNIISHKYNFDIRMRIANVLTKMFIDLYPEKAVKINILNMIISFFRMNTELINYKQFTFLLLHKKDNEVAQIDLDFAYLIIIKENLELDLGNLIELTHNRTYNYLLIPLFRYYGLVEYKICIPLLNTLILDSNSKLLETYLYSSIYHELKIITNNLSSETVILIKNCIDKLVGHIKRIFIKVLSTNDFITIKYLVEEQIEKNHYEVSKIANLHSKVIYFDIFHDQRFLTGEFDTLLNNSKVRRPLLKYLFMDILDTQSDNMNFKQKTLRFLMYCYQFSRIKLDISNYLLEDYNMYFDINEKCLVNYANVNLSILLEEPLTIEQETINSLCNYNPAAIYNFPFLDKKYD